MRPKPVPTDCIIPTDSGTDSLLRRHDPDAGPVFSSSHSSATYPGMAVERNRPYEVEYETIVTDCDWQLPGEWVVRLLLIEDSTRLQKSLSMGLRKEGFKVDATGDGSEGLWFAESFDYDVIILDLMLPGLDGLSILQKLRQKQRPASVMILSARDTVEDRVQGLESGADDYLVKPFAFEELLARVQALVRRRYGVKQDNLSVGSLQINLATRTVICGGEVVPLPPREYTLLEFLVLRRGTVVSRTEIEEHIYDERTEPMSNVVDAAISTLRKELGKIGEASLIKTRRKAGYLIE